MLKKNKKQVVTAISIVLILFVLSFVFSIFYFNSHKQSNSSDDITVKFDKSKNIIITSDLPISDELGKKIDGKGTDTGIQGYMEISITNNLSRTVEYEIYINKIQLSDEIRGNYIKYYLTDEADNPLKGFEKNAIPTYNDLPVLMDLPGSNLLYRGTIKEKEKQKLILRSWLSDSYVVSNEQHSFNYDVYVRTK